MFILPSMRKEATNFLPCSMHSTAHETRHTHAADQSGGGGGRGWEILSRCRPSGNGVSNGEGISMRPFFRPPHFVATTSSSSEYTLTDEQDMLQSATATLIRTCCFARSKLKARGLADVMQRKTGVDKGHAMWGPNREDSGKLRNSKRDFRSSEKWVRNT